MKEKIVVEMDRIHAEMVEALIPFFGQDKSEVLRNVAIRWMEEHIGTDAFKRLEEIGAIKGYRQSTKT